MAIQFPSSNDEFADRLIKVYIDYNNSEYCLDEVDIPSKNDIISSIANYQKRELAEDIKDILDRLNDKAKSERDMRDIYDPDLASMIHKLEVLYSYIE